VDTNPAWFTNSSRTRPEEAVWEIAVGYQGKDPIPRYERRAAARRFAVRAERFRMLTEPPAEEFGRSPANDRALTIVCNPAEASFTRPDNNNIGVSFPLVDTDDAFP
jgi:hypothetical protein